MNENDYFIKQDIIKGKETVFECLSFLQANPISNKGSLTLWENYHGNSIRMETRLFSDFIPLKILWPFACFLLLNFQPIHQETDTLHIRLCFCVCIFNRSFHSCKSTISPITTFTYVFFVSGNFFLFKSA